MNFRELGKKTQSEIEQVEGQGRPEGSIQDTVPHWTVGVSFPNSHKNQKDQIARDLDQMADSHGGEPGQTSEGPNDFSMSYAFEAGDANTGDFIMMVLNKYKDAEIHHDEEDVTHPSEESLQSRGMEGYTLLAELSARQKNYQAEGVATLTLEVLEGGDGTIKLALRGEPAELINSFPRTEQGVKDALRAFEARTASYKLTKLEQEKLHAAIFAVSESRLTYAQRQSLPNSAFALPGRRYPIHNETHARDSLSRVSAHGTESEIASVKAAVHKRYPSMKIAQESLERIEETKPARNFMTSRVVRKIVVEGSADARTLRDQIKQATKNIAHQERQMKEMTRSLSDKALASARKTHMKTMATLQKAKTNLQKQLAKAMVKESLRLHEKDNADDLLPGREQELIEPQDQAMRMVLQPREKPVYAHGYKTKAGSWYLTLAKEGQDKKDAVDYGPFADEGELRQYMVDRSLDQEDLKLDAGGKKEAPETKGDKGWETSPGLRGFRTSAPAKDPEEHEKDIGDTMKLKPTDGKEVSKITAKSIMSANPKLYTKGNQTPK